jgi:hypothetical protein
VTRRSKQVSESHPLAIHCDRHGVTAYCIICRHLRESSGLAYWAIKPKSEEPAQAWCEECDAVLAEDRGWTDRGDALADWKLYCTGCYAETLARHTRRGWDSGGPHPAE